MLSSLLAAVKIRDKIRFITWLASTLTLVLMLAGICALVVFHDGPLTASALLAHAPIIVLLLVAGMGLSFLLADALQQPVSGPLVRMAATMRRMMEEKNFSLRLQHLSDDELGIIVDQFNALLDEVETRDRELRGLRANLENAILSRTRELERARGESQYAHDFINQILNAIPDPVAVKDHQFRYIAGNSAFNSLFAKGVSPIGQSDAELFSVNEAARLQREDTRTLEEGAGTSDMRFGGEHYLARKMRVKGRDGKPMIVASFRNLGHEKGTAVPVMAKKETHTPALPLDLLVIEDNPISQRVAQDVFARLGHAITLAENFNEALAKGKSQRLSAVFAALGDGSAEQAVLYMKAVKGGDVSPPLLAALVSDERQELRDSLLASGFDAVLTKPLLASDVAEILKRLQN